MIAITRQTTPFATMVLVITIAATFIRLYLNPFELETEFCRYMPLWWQAVISSLLIFATAIVVNRTAVKMGILSGFGTLPVSLYAFLSCGILLTTNLLTATVAATLTAFGLMHMLKSIVAFDDKQSLFTGALCLGTAVIVQPACIAFVWALTMAIFIFPLSMRKIIITFTGFFIPLVAVSYVNWYMGGSITDIATHIIATLSRPVAWELDQLPIVTAALALLLGVIVAFGILSSIHNRYSLLVSVRKTIQIVSWFMLSAIPTLLLPCGGTAMIATIAVPATIVAAFAIDRMEQNVANIAYGLIIVLVLAHLFIY